LQPLSSRFPGSDALALDLLSKMITFNPVARITVDQALAHPFLASVRKPAMEFNAAEPMVMHIEEYDLSVERTQEFVSLRFKCYVFCLLFHRSGQLLFASYFVHLLS
jgi:serine/threonine protein kinase